MRKYAIVYRADFQICLWLAIILFLREGLLFYSFWVTDRFGNPPSPVATEYKKIKYNLLLSIDLSKTNI